jgi:hypothetical protein
LSLPLAAAACGAEPGTGSTEDPAGQNQEAIKVCPYAIPYCAPECKLVGGCPQQCVCDNGQSTLCGSQHCGKNQYCCDSTTVGYECLAIGAMCPL